MKFALDDDVHTGFIEERSGTMKSTYGTFFEGVEVCSVSLDFGSVPGFNRLKHALYFNFHL